MYCVMVTVRCKPGTGEAFLAAALRNREGTRTEPGNVRFDVLRSENPAAPGEIEQFFLLEIYRSPEAFAEHQKTPHYFAFRDEVADMMAEPRQGMKYIPVHADPFE